MRRFVNISSPTVYFEMKDKVNVREDALLPPPINAYAATKAEAEQLVLTRTDLGPINLRPRGLYGAGTRHSCRVCSPQPRSGPCRFSGMELPPST